MRRTWNEKNVNRHEVSENCLKNVTDRTFITTNYNEDKVTY